MATRKAVLSIVDTIRLPYSEEAPIAERIKEYLLTYYNNTPYRCGKIAKILSIKVEPSLGVESYADGLKFIAKFEATTEVHYLNLGDMLFNAELSEKQVLNSRKILMDLPFEAVADGVPTNINKANLILTSISKGAPPVYRFELAIFPHNFPIVLGKVRGEISKETIEDDRLYKFDGKMPKPSKEIDPYFNIPPRKRAEMAATEIAKFVGIDQDHTVLGAEFLYSSKKFQKLAIKRIEKPLILFLPLDKVEAIITQLTYPFELIYHPTMPLDKQVIALIILPNAAKSEYSPLAFKLFKQRLEERWAMKRLEGESIKHLSKEFLKIIASNAHT